MTKKEIRSEAWKKIKGFKWDLWKPILIIAVIEMIVSTLASGIFGAESDITDLINSLCSFLLIPATIGQVIYVLNFIRGKEYSIDILKDAYNENTGKYIGFNIVISLIAALSVIPLVLICSMALVKMIPSINVLEKVKTLNEFIDILSFTTKDICIFSILTLVAIAFIIFISLYFSFAQYILADSAKYTAKEFVKHNVWFSRGYKWDYFLFMISFIPEILLCLLIVPIIYVVPHITVAQAMYYEKVKVEKEAK